MIFDFFNTFPSIIKLYFTTYPVANNDTGQNNLIRVQQLHSKKSKEQESFLNYLDYVY